MTYDTVRRLMPVTFRAVSLRRADEETTPGVHCLNAIAVKDKPLPEVARTAERQCLCAEKEAQPVVRLELAHEWTKLWMPTIPWSEDAHSVRGDLQNRTRGHRTMRGMNPIWARCPRERTSLRTPSRSFVSGLVLLALRCLGSSGVWLVISQRAKTRLAATRVGPSQKPFPCHM